MNHQCKLRIFLKMMSMVIEWWWFLLSLNYDYYDYVLIYLGISHSEDEFTESCKMHVIKCQHWWWGQWQWWLSYHGWIMMIMTTMRCIFTTAILKLNFLRLYQDGIVLLETLKMMMMMIVKCIKSWDDITMTVILKMTLLRLNWVALRVVNNDDDDDNDDQTL